jgi:alpha-D-ribose 1-methylphosphonate 5-triphosphate synthase subunit PhnH
MTTTTLTPRAAREQATFRVLLNAMARPGSIDTVPLHENGSEHAAALSVIESLVDHEVTFGVLPERAPLIDAVLRQTGSRLAAAEEADYLLCEGDSLIQALDLAKEGSLEYPDKGATLICRVSRIATGGILALAGPGIRDVTYLTIDGLEDEAVERFRECNSQPPVGTDIVFVAPEGRVACINRYTRLTKEQL